MAQYDQKTETFLAHFGVKGMKWGIKKAASAVGSVVREVQLSDQEIQTARENHPMARREYKQARLDYKVDKAQYRIDAKTMGRAHAKAILNRDGKSKLLDARAKYRANANKASQETSQERTQRFVEELLESYQKPRDPFAMPRTDGYGRRI